MAHIYACGITDLGLARENNEDRWVVDLSLSLAVIADGMGGAVKGEVAATLTAEAAVAYLRDPEPDLTPLQLAREIVRAANEKVRERARVDVSCFGMGSTIVLALWRPSQLVIANVGDSRAYRWRAGQMELLSYDHTLENELRHSNAMTDSQIRMLHNKNILTMAVGLASEVLMHAQAETLLIGDDILLCTDGLWGSVNETAITGVLAQDIPLPDKAAQLVDLAKAAGGGDNITLILLHYGE